MGALNNLEMNEWVHLFLFIYLQTIFFKDQPGRVYDAAKAADDPTADIWWLAHYLKWMHLCVFISQFFGSVNRIIISITSKVESVDKNKIKENELYKEYHEVSDSIKFMTIMDSILRAGTSCFYMISIIFIADKSIVFFGQDFISEEEWTFDYLSYFYLICLEIMLFMAGFFTIPYVLGFRFIR